MSTPSSPQRRRRLPRAAKSTPQIFDADSIVDLPNSDPFLTRPITNNVSQINENGKPRPAIRTMKMPTRSTSSSYNNRHDGSFQRSTTPEIDSSVLTAISLEDINSMPSKLPRINTRQQAKTRINQPLFKSEVKKQTPEKAQPEFKDLFEKTYDTDVDTSGESLDPFLGQAEHSHKILDAEEEIEQVTARKVDKVIREWPPSPKKSPIKRKLDFGAVIVKQTFQKRNVFEGDDQHDEEHEDSILAYRATPRRRKRTSPIAKTTGEFQTQGSSWSFAGLQSCSFDLEPKKRQELAQDDEEEYGDENIPIPPVNSHNNSPRQPVINERNLQERKKPRKSLLRKQPPRRDINVVNDISATSSTVSTPRQIRLEIHDEDSCEEEIFKGDQVDTDKQVIDKLWLACGNSIHRWNRGDFNPDHGGLAEMIGNKLKW